MGLGKALQRLRCRGKSPVPPPSGGTKPRQPGEEGKAWQLTRSLAGLVLGLVLATLYGALVLLAQGHNIWYCLVTTITLGAGLGLGMAFSVKMRVTVLLSLPYVFTKEGKTLLLLLALGLAMQGPCSNILHNFSRAAESLSCGAELALNQTAERVERAQDPLLKVLGKIKEIAQEAKVVGDHVRKFFRSIMDSISHVGRVLYNVWHWLANMGKVCNEELGSPYHRCVQLFDKARDDCFRAIPFLFFLCYIVSAFKPLCGLANIGLLFCIIPQYIASFLKENIAEPVADSLDRVRREFEFNISASHRFDVNLNASKTLNEVALDIMEEVHVRMQPTSELLGIFTHVSFIAILYVYLQALRYHHQYLHDESFDNIYITRRFVRLDLRQAEQGKPTVLPLSAWERSRYVPPAALWLCQQEQRRYGLQLVGVLRHVLLGLSIILADYGLFWLLDLIRHQLRGEIIAQAPVVMGVTINGTGYTSDIFRDLVSAFDVLQQGNVSVVSQRCLLYPVEPDYTTYLSMGLLYGICLFIAVFGSYIARLRRVVCAAYYPRREQERIVFLHTTILARRVGLARVLRQAATQHAADAKQGGGVLRFLTTRLPVLAPLARFLGFQKKHCLACRTAQRADFITCITSGCKGLYCRECFQALRNICTVCMGPLTFQDTGDEEMDSSDEETVELWLSAVRAWRGEERGRQLRRGIREILEGRGGARRLPPSMEARLRARLREEASGESDGGDSEVDEGSLSSLDFGYQEQMESSGSELEEVVATRPPSRQRREW
ncbi:DC-STAMP domain-containing protein 2 [Patagioenas fasciata]|uniref:DC-STAMP domain-containing protein 2 n=1 Tax=Patagioenas fasciata TaxID=372321 RepID=UPI003A99529B